MVFFGFFLHMANPLRFYLGMAWDDQFSWDCEIKPLVPGQTSPPFPGSTVGRSCMAAQVAGTWDDVFTAAAEAKKAGATTLFIYGQGVNVAALGPAPMSMAAAVQVAILNEATGHGLIPPHSGPFSPSFWTFFIPHLSKLAPSDPTHAMTCDALCPTGCQSSSDAAHACMGGRGDGACNPRV